MSFLNTGIYSGGATYEAPVYEGYSFEHGGAQTIAMESFDDNLAVLEALSALDIHILRESSVEVVTEAASGGVVERIKAALKKLWGKIKAFFESIIRFFDSLTKSAADFAKKYADKLRKIDLSGFKYKMYNYTIPEDPATIAVKASDAGVGPVADKLNSFTGHDLEAGKAAIEAIKEGKEDLQGKIRGLYARQSGGLDEGEFRTALFAYFRDGAESESDKDEVSVDIFAIMDTVKGSAKLKTAITKARDAEDKLFANYLRDLDNAQKKMKFDKGGDTGSNAPATGSEGSTGNAAVFAGLCKLYNDQVQFAKSTSIAFYNAWINAVKERDRTYKSVMAAAFRHKAE